MASVNCAFVKFIEFCVFTPILMSEAFVAINVPVIVAFVAFMFVASTVFNFTLFAPAIETTLSLVLPIMVYVFVPISIPFIYDALVVGALLFA